MKVKFFDLTRQTAEIKDELNHAISDVLDSGVYNIGPKTAEFEREYAKLNSVSFCILTGSGTQSLELALRCLDLPKKSKVLTTALSFMATASAINQNGLEPLFVDTDSTCNLSLEEVYKHIDNVKCVLPVALYGNSPDLITLQNLCKAKNIPIIGDFCQAHFTERNNIPIARLVDIAVQSFYCTKALGNFLESGCILTNNKDYYNRLRVLRDHGRVEVPWKHEVISGNYRGSELSAGILLVKLKHIRKWVTNRVLIYQKYNKLLKEAEEQDRLKLLEVHPDTDICPYVYPIFVKNRGEIQSKLEENDVFCNIHYRNILPTQPAYSYLGHNWLEFPMAHTQSFQTLSLPFFPEITDGEINYVAENLLKIL